jgi:hypothetical protein
MKRLSCCAFFFGVGLANRVREDHRGKPWAGRGITLLMSVWLSACSVAPTWPDLPLPETMTRASIEAYRGRAEERLQYALRECYQRFAVNDCRREALTRHRDVQHHLRTQELRLNALDREERQRKQQSLPDAKSPAAPVDTPSESRP